MIRLLFVVMSALLLTTANAMAQTCATLPQALNNGDNADATKVTADLEHLRTCINSLVVIPPGTVAPFSGAVLPNGWLWANGATVSRTTYAALWAALSKTDTVTISIASPAVITWTSGAHGLANDWPIKLFSTGALPTGLVAGTTYFVKSATTNTFRLASAPGGADINTSGSQSGTQTAVFAPYGNGDDATTFGLPDLRGRAPFGLDNLGGATAAGRVTAALSGIAATSPGAAGGEQAHTLTTSEMPSHSHGVLRGAGVPGVTTPRGTFGDGTAASVSGFTENAGGSAPHNTMPPTLMMNYIVKY